METERPSVVESPRWPDALPRPGNRRLKRLESASPWFEVYQVNADTFALLEPRHEEEVISYLALGSERAALIDTGMGISDVRAEVERLTDLPVVVVNTHAHFDHVGGDHRFGEVWAFDDASEVARIERGYSRAECAPFIGPGSYRELPDGFDPAAYEIRPSRVTRRLRHREAIELGARTLTVHHTPGHSPVAYADCKFVAGGDRGPMGVDVFFVSREELDDLIRVLTLLRDATDVDHTHLQDHGLQPGSSPACAEVTFHLPGSCFDDIREDMVRYAEQRLKCR